MIDAPLLRFGTLPSVLWQIGSAEGADSGPIWREVRERLREEPDYVNAAENLTRISAEDLNPNYPI